MKVNAELDNYVELYLIRHGTSVWNESKEAIGSFRSQIASWWNKNLVNPVLTDQGERDAKDINEWIKTSKHPAAVEFRRKALNDEITWITSNLKRAIDTLLWAFGADENSIFAQMLKKFENIEI